MSLEKQNKTLLLLFFLTAYVETNDNKAVAFCSSS